MKPADRPAGASNPSPAAQAAAPSDEPLKATLGRYQLVASVARGGMSEVYLALAKGQMGFTKLVVLKCLRGSQAPTVLTSMFRDEVRLAARLNHPNIVSTFDVGEEKGVAFLAMEFLEGQPLHHVMKAFKNLPPEQQPHPELWLRLICDVLAGLSYAHNLRDFDGKPLEVVHRDISPQNIFVTYDGAVKVVDFGIAKATSNANHTDTGTIKGKIRYMAPEQLQARPVDGRTDVFSVGIVLWELLAKQGLLSGDMAPAVAQLLAQAPLPMLSTVVPEIPKVLETIVARALEKDIAMRYQSAAEMRSDVLEYLRHSATPETGTLGPLLALHFAQARARVRSSVEEHVKNAGRLREVGELESLELGGLSATPSSQMNAELSGWDVDFQNENQTIADMGLPLEVIEPLPGATVSTRRRWALALGTFVAFGALSYAGYSVFKRAPIDEVVPASVALAEAVIPPSPVVLLEQPAVQPRIPSDEAETQAEPAPMAKNKPPAQMKKKPHAIKGPLPTLSKSDPTSAAPDKPTVSPGDLGAAPASPASPETLPKAEPLTTKPEAPAPQKSNPPETGYSTAVVRDVVQANREAVQDCYDRASLDGRRILGKVQVNITVNAQGRVTDVVPKSTILEGGARLEMCLQTSIRSWKFPARSDGSPATCGYTFNFK
jgi:serine/threonine protein kinase/outer membrane biosynthesis protein TonB